MTKPKRKTGGNLRAVDEWQKSAALAYQLLHQHKFPEALEAARGIVSANISPFVTDSWTAAIKDVQMIEALLSNRPTLDQLKWGVSCDWDGMVSAQLPESDALSVVFFHVNSSGNHPFAGKAVDYLATLSGAWRAARVSNPDARVIIVTDEVSELPPIRAEVVRLPAKASLMMYDRMRANRALAASGKLRGPVVFIDTDVLLNRDFSLAFTGFDIGLTYRPDQTYWHMPVNEAMILAAKGDAPETVAHFSRTLALYDWIAGHRATQGRYGFDVRLWRGGQLSLAALVGWNVPQGGVENVVMADVKYTLLPCSTFNYPVEQGDKLNRLRSKWAVHFKGDTAKAAIGPYLAASSGP